MDPNWAALQTLGLEGARQENGLSTPPPIDHADNGAGTVPASKRPEELPEEFLRLQDAAVRGDIDLVKSIFESERLPNTSMERMEDEQYVSVMHKALLKRRENVVAYFLSQGIPFNLLQVEVAIQEGLQSLL